MRRAIVAALMALAGASRAAAPSVPPCAELPRVTVAVKPFALAESAPEDSTHATVAISGRIAQPANCTTIGATFQGVQEENAPGVSGPLPVAPDGTFSAIVSVPVPQDGQPFRLRVRAVVVNEAGTGRSAPVEIDLP